MYRTRDNLVSFCTEDQLIGLKPNPYWQRCHDVDLILGVYKYGFGNYQQIKEDKKFSWADLL